MAFVGIEIRELVGLLGLAGYQDEGLYGERANDLLCTFAGCSVLFAGFPVTRIEGRDRNLTTC